MSDGAGAKSALNIVTPTLVAITTSSSYVPLRLNRVQVLVAGSAPGSINDSSTIAGAVTPNQVYVIPNIVGSYWLDFPCLSGIVVTPGTGQTVAVAYGQ